MLKVRIQTADFDPGAELAVLGQGREDVGAVASFLGIARAASGGERIERMVLEHYPGMTEAALQAILEQAQARWAVADALVLHRVGEILPGGRIVLVGVAGSHRGEAFDACRYIVDFLKTEAPFWKKEYTASGARWVQARAADEAAREAWHA